MSKNTKSNAYCGLFGRDRALVWSPVVLDVYISFRMINCKIAVHQYSVGHTAIVGVWVTVPSILKYADLNNATKTQYDICLCKV